MTFLSDQITDLDRQFTREDILYTFTNGVPSTLAQTFTGSGSASAVGYDDANGAALKVTMGADPGTARIDGPLVNPSAVKAVLIDAQGISYSASGDPLFALGFYTPDGSFANYVELYRDNLALGHMTTQKSSSTYRTKVDTGTGTNIRGADYDAGLLLNYNKNIVTGHVGHAYVQANTAANIPTVSLQFRIRALTSPSTSGSFHDYSVYLRKITLSIWR